jgi:hypothetical protein
MRRASKARPLATGNNAAWYRNKDTAMGKRLSVPPELEHLIEKREGEEDRRAGEERRDAERREDDLGPIGAIESTENLDDLPAGDRRGDQERRQSKDRRHRRRRKPG